MMDWITKVFPAEEFVKAHGPLALSLFIVLVFFMWAFYQAIMTIADKRVKEISDAKDKEIERLCDEKKYLQEKLLNEPLASSCEKATQS